MKNVHDNDLQPLLRINGDMTYLLEGTDIFPNRICVERDTAVVRLTLHETVIQLL